ncbi:hypothetical protein [Chitinophaga sp. Cy-1792]|uniref:TlpA family protein disulfide reductase n=1 Tax=Chitinophaga sp. Cy-1792 TaxID=2608339 RepID=UPI0014210C13|nr:hypothetical protein [Chitinophaga sp. Cy-1792]NIG57564.1 hypothetical protein [Chitinophaga sp. Cy-1792]
MPKIISFWIIFLLYVQGVAQPKTTILLKVRPGELMNFYYYDSFQDQHRLAANGGMKDTLYKFDLNISAATILVYNIRTFSPYIIFPGDSILFSYTDKVLLPHNLKSMQYPADLVFMAGSINNASGYFGPYATQPVKPGMSILGLAARQSSIEKRFLNQMAVLDSTEEQGRLSARMKAYAKVHITYLRYLATYLPYMLEGKAECINGLPVQDSMVFKRDSLMENYYYREAAFAYYKFLLHCKNISAAIDLEKYFSPKTLSYILFADMKTGKSAGIVWKLWRSTHREADVYSYYLQRLQDTVSFGRGELVTKNSPSDTIPTIPNRLLYIDFWASWCVPCREEMKRWEEHRAVLSGMRTIYVFMSIDKNIMAWENASREDRLTDYSYNYWVKSKDSLSIARKIGGIKTIPRYCICFNGEILVPDAPRPSSPELLPLLKRLESIYLSAER